MTNKVLLDVTDGVGTITLNRPQVHNAMDDEASAQFAELLDAALADERVRVVLLRGDRQVVLLGT